MKTKNLGITQACPECKKPLFRDAVFSGEGSFSVKCGHCQNPTYYKVKIGNKTYIDLTKIVYTVGVIALVAFLASLPLFKGQSLMAFFN